MEREQALASTHALGDLLRRSAERMPGKPALIDRDTTLSYAQLDATANAIANALAQRGVTHGDRVALLARNSWQFVAVSFGLARLGALLVPVNFMLGPGEVAYILGHSGATGMIADAALTATAAEAIDLAGGMVALRGWIGEGPAPAGWDDVAEWAAFADATPPDVLVADDDPLRLMYTSGTESRPKGASHSSRSLIAQYVSCIVGGEMAADDVEIHSLPMYHCAQLDCFLGPSLYLGATNVVLPAPDPEAILAAVERHRATKLFCPPTVWIGLLDAVSFDSTDLSSLRKGYYGASPMPVEVLRRMRDKLPGLRLWNMYGQTELAPLATLLGPDDQVTHAGSAGRAALHVSTRVVDDAGQEVPPGEIGEIVHRTPHATGGYWEDPQKTAEAFQGGWFHSGDLGTMDADGYLTVVDRKKDMIKTGGENVASREVEEAIYTHPAVAEVAVFALPDDRWIEVVTAAVVLRDGHAASGEDIVAHCRQSLAGYKTPKSVHVVDELPKNPSGKILKRQLREQFA